MIISRAPLRISIAGGGTDFPEYFLNSGTSWISASIDKYCYTQSNLSFDSKIFLKYSKYEKVKKIGDIKHDLIREVLKKMEVESNIELTFSADVPAGTGLGSSGSFLVSLIENINSFKNNKMTINEIAQMAIQIEKEVLQQPVGYQDQFIAATGGITKFEAKPNGEIQWQYLNLNKEKIINLQDHLILFYTGITRDSKKILTSHRKKIISGDQKTKQYLDKVRDNVNKIQILIENQHFFELGKMFHDHWNIKKNSDHLMTSKLINNFYEFALKNGAIGGKLIGAGAGGFMLLVTEEKIKLRKKLKNHKFTELPFSFDLTGSTTIYRD